MSDIDYPRVSRIDFILYAIKRRLELVKTYIFVLSMLIILISISLYVYVITKPITITFFKYLTAISLFVYFVLAFLIGYYVSEFRRLASDLIEGINIAQQIIELSEKAQSKGGDIEK